MFSFFWKNTLALWFSKPILLYGGNSINFVIFKHVSLWLSVISKCYFLTVFCFWYGQIFSLFFIVSDVFRKINIFSSPKKKKKRKIGSSLLEFQNYSKRLQHSSSRTDGTFQLNVAKDINDLEKKVRAELLCLKYFTEQWKNARALEQTKIFYLLKLQGSLRNDTAVKSYGLLYIYHLS